MHVVRLVPPSSQVLEVGCATGYMSRVLREEKGCEITGIEISPEAAEKAKAFCKRVIVGDVETLDLPGELDGARFEAVLFADVLEHLRDPGTVLGRIRPFVAEGGTVVASIPNVAHGSVRLALLDGEFRYRPLGLLDDTHLRFFTRATIEALFEAAGYIVLRWIRRQIPIDETEISVGAVPDDLRARLAGDPNATTYQFIVQATPSEAAPRVTAARLLLDEARNELEELRREVEALRVEVEAVRSAHGVLSGRLAAERLAMADRVRQLEEEVEWRTVAMDGLEERLAALYRLRSFRYTAPARAVFQAFQRRR